MVSSPTARVVLCLLATLLTASVMAGPATAAPPPAPGNFTGYGFDACSAPNQKSMDAWNLNSPFSAIGIYISGNSRYCGAKYQTNLTKAWVQKNADNGWHFMPIHVGYQSPCFKNNKKSRVQKKLMSRTLATARSQATSDAKESMSAAIKLGLPAGSVLYLDMEYWRRDKGACDNAVREFADAWTETLHAAGFKSGLYSSGSAAIKMTDELVAAGHKGFSPPDHLWSAWTAGHVASTAGGGYIGDTRWSNHQRIHQYWNGVTMTYGGATINIDKNFLDVGNGSVVPAEGKQCGLTMTFSSYPSLYPKVKKSQVSAAQCLLTAAGFKAPATGMMDVATTTAVNRFKKSRGWVQDGKITRREWVALLANGNPPRILKFGSVGEPVRRLQRALLADQAPIKVTGRYDTATEKAVAALRKFNKAPSATTTEATVWRLLNAGSRHH